MHRRNAASLSNGQIIYRIVSHDVKSILEWWLLWKILDWAWGLSTTGAIVTAAVSVLSRYRGLSWQRELRGALIATVAVALLTAIPLVMVQRPLIAERPQAVAPSGPYIGEGTAPPTSGNFKQGDQWRNSKPRPGDILGWVWACDENGHNCGWKATASVSM